MRQVSFSCFAAALICAPISAGNPCRHRGSAGRYSSAGIADTRAVDKALDDLRSALVSGGGGPVSSARRPLPYVMSRYSLRGRRGEVPHGCPAGRLFFRHVHLQVIVII